MPADQSPSDDIVCTGLSKLFAGGILAVDGIGLTFAAGRTTALLGPSGCGKSTLLRMIAGLEDPTAGQVRIAGDTPAALCRQGAMSIAFQDPCLLPWLTLRRNIALGRKLARQAPELAQRADRLSREVDAMAEHGLRFDDDTARRIGEADAVTVGSLDDLAPTIRRVFS